MNPIVKNRPIDAFLKLLLVSAVIHFIILVVQSLKDGNISHLNYFAILELQAFFPHILNGSFSFLLSLLIVVVLYFVLYFKYTKNH
ncbi:hypothetical protein KW805_03690 [Candidatus Pacearchaeota archaeon]|nr:hypothetical protein [Candidatus Pacearchaeota archaeon]